MVPLLNHSAIALRMNTHFDIPDKFLEMVPEVKKFSGDNQSVWINSTLHKNSISVETSLEIMKTRTDTVHNSYRKDQEIRQSQIQHTINLHWTVRKGSS